MQDILRSINLILAIVVIVWLASRRIAHPSKFPRGGLLRDIWAMAFCWALALIVSNVEQLLDTDTYIRVGVSMAAILTTLAILMRPAADWPKPKPKSSR